MRNEEFNMKKYIRLAAIMIFALSCIATTVLAVAGQESKGITVEKISPDYVWVLETPDEHGVVQVKITLSDAAKKPVKGKVLTGQLWMPKMPMHGYPEILEFKETGEGQYSAAATYKHGGYWQIKAQFKNDKGQSVEEEFDFDIKKN